MAVQQRVVVAAATPVLVLGFMVGVALPASGSVSSSSLASASSTYSKPTWWQKFQTVSAPGFTPLPNPGITKSFAVGPNIDASNEPGPQSETSIAINPSSPAQIVAGSNEIFRLPMRGYFSSDGGSSWGAVDLPLPPPLTTNGTDFGSGPAVPWGTHRTRFSSPTLVPFSTPFP